MANLNELVAEYREKNGSKRPMPAGRTEILKPEAYLEECEGKPASPILVGLRTPNDDDYTSVTACENDHDAMLTLVSRGICDPNDCTRRHPSFPFPDIQVKKHLKPETIRYLFDRIEQLHLETSPVVPLATDEDLYLLGLSLQVGDKLDAIESKNLVAGNRIRRLATAIIDALNAD
jgi:hypothetical protein